MIARAPYKWGDPYRDSWSFYENLSFNDKDVPFQDSADAVAAREKQEYNSEMRRRYRQKVKEKRKQGRKKIRLYTFPEGEEEEDHLLKHEVDCRGDSELTGQSNAGFSV